MPNVSMTATLGVAAVVGAIAITILGGSKDRLLADGKDQASIPKQCKTEACTVKTTVDQFGHKSLLKSAQQSKSIQAMAVEESANESLTRKPVRRLAKKHLQQPVENTQPLLVEEPPQQLVEKAQSRRLRRADDPFLDSFN